MNESEQNEAEGYFMLKEAFFNAQNQIWWNI